MGHSFGGYTAVQYLRTKKPDLNHLYLLSPAGMTHKDESVIEDQLKDQFKFSWWKRKLFKGILYLIQDH